MEAEKQSVKRDFGFAHFGKDQDALIDKLNQVVEDAWEREKALRLGDYQWQLDFLMYHENGLRKFFDKHGVSEEEINYLMGDGDRDFLDEWVKSGLVVREGYDANDNLFSIGQVREIEIPLKGIIKTPVSDEDREFINKHTILNIPETERNYGNAVSDSIFICVDANQVKDFLKSHPIDEVELSYSSPGM